jgi:hypothetical protein
MVLATVSGFGAPAEGQVDPRGNETVLIPRLSGPIVLDGRVDEPAWEEVPVLPATMHRPTYMGTPTETTEFRVAHDGTFFYLGCRLYDSDPSGIRALSLERDETSFSNDWCAIGLDTFLDRENMHLVGTNPAGQRTDLVFANDAEGAPDPDWNTFWDAEVSQNENGWEAEIRVPFSSLRFQETDGVVIMGLLIFRNIARKNEVHTFPGVEPRWGTFSLFKASQAQPVILRGIRDSNPLYVTPYAIGGAGYTHDENEAETGYDRETSRLREAGLDLKYGLTENLTLDVSVNTDFAQVEADDAQVNLTRFSLFFPEKRPFFKERSGVFEFSLGGNERLFHSRRIGLSEGEALRIFGGARVVGRIGEWDVGALTMQTEAPEAVGSPENTAVLRLRRRVWNENSYLNGIFTSRLGNDATENVLYGFDAILRLFGQDYLTLNWAQSFDGEDGSDVKGLDRTLARFYWQRRGVDGLAYEADLSRAGEAFEPGLGFLFRRDYTKSRVSLGYGWRPGQESPLLRYALAVEALVYHRGEDGYLETGEFTPTFDLGLKSGHTFTASVISTREYLEEGFEPSDDTEVLAGRYTYSVGSLEFTQSTGDRIRTDVSAEYGGYFDGRRASASVTTTANLSRHLEVQGTYRVDDVVFEERDQEFRAHIARFRIEPRLNTKLTGATLVQYNSASNAFLVNARLRWNPREGNDLYVVWNEGLVTDRRSFDPIRPFSDQRTILVKYSHTFTMGF